jgi:hypothetical protein
LRKQPIAEHPHNPLSLTGFVTFQRGHVLIDVHGFQVGDLHVSVKLQKTIKDAAENLDRERGQPFDSTNQEVVVDYWL